MGLLLHVPKREWLPPSVSQARNVLGHLPVERRWHVKARLADGHVRWHGVFEDREDFDAFLVAIAMGTLDRQPDLWRLPVPQYFPDYGEGALFLFAASITVTASGSQSKPSDWNNDANTIEGIGGGGSGSCGAKQNGNRSGGGSGAEYRKVANYAAGSTFTYTIGAGGTAVTRSTAGVTAGNDGGDTILDTSILIAKKGLGGTVLNGSNPTAPAGGTGGTGAAGNANGGAGGAVASNDCATGGGGAGGPSGAGAAGQGSVAAGGNNTASTGGGGGNGSGGASGAGQVLGTASTATGTAGGSGADITTGVGSGGGGGAALNTSTGAAQGGAGGNYGAAGGAATTKVSGGNTTSGAGMPGVLYFVYTPLVTGSLLWNPNVFTHILTR